MTIPPAIVEWDKRLLLYLDLNCPGKDKAMIWDRIEEAMRKLGYKGSRADLRDGKRRLIRNGYLVGSCPNGIFRIKTSGEWEDAKAFLRVKANELERELSALEGAGRALFTPQSEFGGMPLRPEQKLREEGKL